MKRSANKKWAFAALALIALSASGYFLWPAGKSTDQLGKVERKDLLQRVTIAGAVTPRRRTLVVAPYTGYVKQVFVEVGDQVKAGQPLVSVTQSLVSQEPVFPLRAPYAGTVVHVQKKEGENVKEDASEYLMRIDDMSKFYVDATAPEVDRAKLVKGQETLIKASAVPDKTYRGVITELTLAPRGGQSSGWGGASQQQYPVRMEVLDKDDKLGPGMTVVVDIITAKKEKVLTIRHEFVQRDAEGQYYAILASGEKRPIKVGMQNEEAFEILDGLKEGESVRQVDFSTMGAE